MTRYFGIIMAMLLGLAMIATPGWARDGHDHDRDDRKEGRDHDRDRDHHGHGDRDRDHDRDDRGDPRGWSHGRKEGWRKSDCDLPPGQARKNPNCGESRRDRDRDRDWSRDRDRDRDRDPFRDRDRDHNRVVANRTPSRTPLRPRTTTVRKPVTTSKQTTHKVRNPAEMIDPKTGKVAH